MATRQQLRGHFTRARPGDIRHAEGAAGTDSPARGVPDIPALLAAAVAGIGGTERPGQVTMAGAVRDAIESTRHLAVQAGTGTGKSLAYLVPATAHAVAAGAAV